MLHLPVSEEPDAHALMARLHKEVVWRCKQLTGADVCAIYELHAEDNLLELVEHAGEVGIGGEDAPAFSSPFDAGGAPSLDGLLDDIDEDGDGEEADAADAADAAGGGAPAAEASSSKPRVTLKVGHGLVGSASASRKIRIVQDPSSCADFDAATDNPLNVGPLRSMALAPCCERGSESDSLGKVGGGRDTGAPVIVLYNKGRHVGDLSVHERRDAFSDADARLLAVYARLVGAVKSYVDTMREQQEHLASSHAVIEIGMTLTSNLQGQNLHYNITSLARQLVPCEWSTLYLCDEGTTYIRKVRENGLPGGLIKLGEGVAGSVAQTMAPVHLPYVATDPRFDVTHYGERGSRVRGILAFPLIDSHGELKAVLELVNRKDAPAFRKDDETELLPFCKLAGITLHNSRTLQVARDTGQGPNQRLERRNSMIGVRRSSVHPQAQRPRVGEDQSAAPAEHETVEIGLLSSRKMRASIY